MGFRELIKKVQDYSGFSDRESKEALEHMVESLSVHLTEGERKDFASQLPQELQDIALAVYPTEAHARQDMLEQFMENQHIDEPRAKKQILSAWKALKDAISPGEIDDIRAQLPNKTVQFLH
ncbi:MAG: hypoxic response protein 1 [Candidatus Saccharibacteria bacterium]|nr:hypoxic response protein 1 [Candidatus Saccharibacteria bacterium]